MSPKHPAERPTSPDHSLALKPLKPDRNSPSSVENRLRTVVRLLAHSAAREWFEADQLRQQSAQKGATSPGDRPP
ncbi:hypothetical protein [Gluconobacter sp. GP1]|uniref:hypothetical protein n=1 Tax=Gluconobacter sp. GP1 TaxID=3046423 RepID=UPI00293E3CE0|nr:hypothetical protein [Gluconobacter sp. GP1]